MDGNGHVKRPSKVTHIVICNTCNKVTAAKMDGEWLQVQGVDANLLLQDSNIMRLHGYCSEHNPPDFKL